MVRLGRVLVVSMALGVSACAAVWGFDPLNLAPDDTAIRDGIGEGGSSETSDGVPQPGNEGGSSSGGLTCEGFNYTCSCSTGGLGNSQPCSPSSIGVDTSSVVCCADPSYPSSGSCMCNWIGCTTSNGTCICGPGNGTPGGSCESGSWTCCLQTGATQCLCAPISCQNGFVPHGNACEISEITCSGAQHKVDSCR